MVLLWYEYALVAAIFAAILTLTVGIAFSLSRVRVQKWIGGAIGNFMTNLAEQAAEEGNSSPASAPINLGGFKIDPQMIKLAAEYGPQLVKLAQGLGFLKGGGGSTGGSGL